jgi:hypothetical protein
MLCITIFIIVQQSTCLAYTFKHICLEEARCSWIAGVYATAAVRWHTISCYIGGHSPITLILLTRQLSCVCDRDLPRPRQLPISCTEVSRTYPLVILQFYLFPYQIRGAQALESSLHSFNKLVQMRKCNCPGSRQGFWDIKILPIAHALRPPIRLGAWGDIHPLVFTAFSKHKPAISSFHNFLCRGTDVIYSASVCTSPRTLCIFSVQRMYIQHRIYINMHRVHITSAFHSTSPTYAPTHQHTNT